ncbi:alpha/beta-hydrolase [Colletotrichum caudatum]|nr:alpha/beta-hydrolase [Colletotrichum caudatum]
MGNNISYQETPVEISLGNRGTIRGLQLDKKAPDYTYSDTIGGAYDATKFRPVCPQKDCLFVNIWTPVPAEGEENKKWPVQLRIHGGWFQIGYPSHEPGMDATELTTTGGLNSVIVAIGYRPNIFGFLAGEALLNDNNGEAGGNFGLWDQRIATVYPDNITLAGRSAGAYSVEAQMLYDFRKPGDGSSLYSRVFMASNAIPAQPRSLAEVQRQFEELCDHFEINSGIPNNQKLEILRTKSVEELLGATPYLKNHTFRPVTDDIFIHTGMVDYLQSRGFANEFKKRKYKILIDEPQAEPTLDALRLQISNYYAPDVTDRAIQQYTVPRSGKVEDWQNIFGLITADGQVRAPSRLLVKVLVDNGFDIQDVWRYQIAYRMSFIDEKVAPASYGVSHAMDRPIWNFALTHGPTPAKELLMKDWIEILVAFMNNRETYEFGTNSIQEMKVMTPEGNIEIRQDNRWNELVNLGKIFAGK